MVAGIMIKNARKRAGLTQKQLGEFIGVSSVTISKYELDKLKVSVDIFLQILEVCQFEISFNYKGKEFTVEQLKREFK